MALKHIQATLYLILAVLRPVNQYRYIRATDILSAHDKILAVLRPVNQYRYIRATDILSAHDKHLSMYMLKKLYNKIFLNRL